MHLKSFVSIIVSDLETHPSLPRLLHSISHQSTGLDQIEIIIAGNGSHPSSAPSLWRDITSIENIHLENIGESATPSMARNHAAAIAKGDFFLFLRPDYRLDSKYLTTIFSVLTDHPEADIVYTDYIRLASKKDSTTHPGMVQLPRFSEKFLQSRNFLGPAVLLTRNAWKSTQGFKENTIYRDWDLWVQAALAGNYFFHVNYPLASCEHHKISFRERAEDGRCKAMIVINNQAYYHMHTVKWALSYLRGDAWAEAYGFMTIPGPMDVTKMMHDFNMRQMGTDIMAEEAIRQFDQTSISSEAQL
jgi:hypothetical protein